jgi:manganese oxidase
MVGVDPGDLDKRLQPLLPGYMTMGTTGMAEMGEHAGMMPMPRNTISMKGAAGPFADISMGGLVTILKVRDDLQSYDEDPGWYEHPSGTVALKASDEELRRDGIDVTQLSGNGSKTNGSIKSHAGH